MDNLNSLEANRTLSGVKLWIVVRQLEAFIVRFAHNATIN
jgi:hypothetical protein